MWRRYCFVYVHLSPMLLHAVLLPPQVTTTPPLIRDTLAAAHARKGGRTHLAGGITI